MPQVQFIATRRAKSGRDSEPETGPRGRGSGEGGTEAGKARNGGDAQSTPQLPPFRPRHGPLLTAFLPPPPLLVVLAPSSLCLIYSPTYLLLPARPHPIQRSGSIVSLSLSRSTQPLPFIYSCRDEPRSTCRQCVVATILALGPLPTLLLALVDSPSLADAGIFTLSSSTVPDLLSATVPLVGIPFRPAGVDHPQIPGFSPWSCKEVRLIVSRLNRPAAPASRRRSPECYAVTLLTISYPVRFHIQKLPRFPLKSMILKSCPDDDGVSEFAPIMLIQGPLDLREKM